MATENSVATTGHPPDSELNGTWQAGLWKSLKELVQLILSSKTAVIGLVIVLLWVLVAIFAPLITTYSPLEQDYKTYQQGPIGRTHSGHRQSGARCLGACGVRRTHHPSARTHFRLRGLSRRHGAGASRRLLRRLGR